MANFKIKKDLEYGQDPESGEISTKKKPWWKKYPWIMPFVVALVGVVLVVALFTARERNSNRDAEIQQNAVLNQRLQAVSCNSYDTLYRLIVGTPTAPRAVYVRLGFNDQQIDELIEVSKKAKENQLQTLGPRPKVCGTTSRVERGTP